MLLASRSRAHLTSTLFLISFYLYTYSISYHPRRYALAPVSASCFSFLVSASSTLLLTCFASLACMCTSHTWPVSHASYYVYASLLYMYTSHLVLRVTMHLLHIIHYTTALYLYSVLLGRASSAVVLQRLPNIRCLSCLHCTCSTTLSYRNTRVNLRRTPES